MNDIEKWIHQKDAIPSVFEMDKAYVPGYNLDDENFRLAITNPRLLSLLTKRGCLQMDGTYKLLKLNCPIIVGSTSGMNRVIHGVIICISRHEAAADNEFVLNILISSCQRVNGSPFVFDSFITDAASSITAAFEKVLPGKIRNVCYFHANAE